jgi:uridylate kinase
MLKVSGEALQGDKGFGLDPAVVEAIAREIKAARQHGIEVAVVVGGGNYFRGASAWKGLERATADYVGMLATVMNALCLQVGQGWGSLATTSQLSPVHACAPPQAVSAIPPALPWG